MPDRAPSRRWPRRIPLCIANAVLVAGTLAAWHYASAGLALSHYDARAHLVVARRIFDSLTPGWQQIGAVWLPLPHVLNAIPVQVDAWYRSGASGTAISVISMAAAAWALAALIVRTTGSVTAAAAGAVLLMVNPNVLYLQSTPMTEPLLFGTTFVGIALTAAWLDRGAPVPARAPGLALAAACMTRYEAWLVTVATVVLSALVLWRRGRAIRETAYASARLAAYPIVVVALFMLNSRWTVGEWFVSGGFFAAENEALGRPFEALSQVQEGLYRLSGAATVWPAWAGAALVAAGFVRSKTRAPLALVLALAAAAALPWFAYFEGHPFRVRYSLPLVAASAAITAVGLSLLPSRLRGAAAAAVVAATLLQASPLDRSAALVVESQRDERNRAGRLAATAYLAEHDDGTTIMMSMGSLAHYMHDLSHAGFNIRDFLHEGNGELWTYALDLGPQGFAGWVAIEERAEGGDILFHHARRNPEWLAGFERVAEGGGVALYRRRDKE
ncbi:MAG TPA: hypothetical protein VLD67_05725 [Vicinamibacterales bacterium]|nr:hypothetical protein [Vicinamibacterales bacterium]